MSISKEWEERQLRERLVDSLINAAFFCALPRVPGVVVKAMGKQAREAIAGLKSEDFRNRRAL